MFGGEEEDYQASVVSGWTWNWSIREMWVGAVGM